MKSKRLLLVVLALVLQSPAPALEKQDEKKPTAPAAERTFTDEEQKLLDEAEKRTKLAWELQTKGNYAEAEKEFRAVLAIGERPLREEYLIIFGSCFNVALCLEDQKKFPEALVFIQRAESGWQKTLGADHRDTKDAKKARERIEEKMKGGK